MNFFGPVGRCPCCGKPTEVRLGGTLSVPEQPDWVVPPEILRQIYSEVGKRTKARASGGKLYILDPHPHVVTHRRKLYFVDGSEGLAGPFGPEGLSSFLRSSCPGTTNVQLYAVCTTDRALRRIQKSPYTVHPSRRTREVAKDLDNPIDLF